MNARLVRPRLLLTCTVACLLTIAAPADQLEAASYKAKGVQIYECRAVAGQAGKSEWAFKPPEADGKTPDEPADESKMGQMRRVEYTATCVFYKGKP